MEVLQKGAQAAFFRFQPVVGVEDLRRQVGAHLMPHVTDQLAENLFLAGEVGVEGPLGDAGGAGDVGDAGAVVTERAESVFGGLENTRPGAGAAGGFRGAGPAAGGRGLGGVGLGGSGHGGLLGP